MIKGLESTIEFVFLDIDGTITKPKANCWLEYTRQIFLFGDPKSELRTGTERDDLADEKARQHAEYYRAYRQKREAANSEKLSSERARLETLAFNELNDQLYDLWSESGVELNEQNVKKIVSNVLKSVITPGGYQLLNLLSHLDKEHNIPTCVLTGSFNFLATSLAEMHGFTGGGFASSELLPEKENDVTVYKRIKHDPELSSSKIRNIIRMAQLRARSNDRDFDPAKAKAIGDGPTDRFVFEVVGKMNSIAIAYTDEDARELSAYSYHVVSSPERASYALFGVLPEEMQTTFIAARDRY